MLTKVVKSHLKGIRNMSNFGWELSLTWCLMANQLSTALVSRASVSGKGPNDSDTVSLILIFKKKICLKINKLFHIVPPIPLPAHPLKTLYYLRGGRMPFFPSLIQNKLPTLRNALSARPTLLFL